MNLSPITLKFLEAVSQNNNTTRMHANRDLYLQEKDRYFGLIDDILDKMKKIDKNLTDITTKDCIYRFNKDIRFSKDKSPYKTRFGAFMSPGGKKSPLPGYYLHIEPGNCGISGGSWCPTPAQRDQIVLTIRRNRSKREDITKNKIFKKYFGEMGDKQDKDLEKTIKSSRTKKIFLELGEEKTTEILQNKNALELLLYPRFCVWHGVKDSEIVQEGFEKEIIKGFKLLQNFNDFILVAF
ncbi:TIGR02453 family protein [candidate division SR1 bacterium]|nr:TIGR02453 family protein [candidate division SR1 bacterium]